MALRLTSSTLQEGPPSASQLAAQAQQLLNVGDTERYGELFARAAQHDDPHRRYQARLALIQKGLESAGQSAAARAAETFLAVARNTIALLEQDPREPLLLNYAGVALYELWSLDAARAMFQAALRLDPNIPHARRNMAECKRRQRAAGGGPKPLRPLHAALSELARRGKRVAAKARPEQGLTLSLCMIVRDEEEMLPRCLGAIADAVDEIVIVDTGSSDRTIEIARSFDAKVIEREWTGSFSDARNASFDAATGDWVMYLDADEVLVREDIEKLRALTGRTWREAFYLLETNYTGEEIDGTAMTHNALRVFRNRPEYRFEGRLHEQIGQNLPGYLPERLEHTTVRVEHYGYLGTVRSAKDKSKRNIELLLAQKAESPPNAFLHFNLGSEYAAINDAPAALAEFERSWAMLQDNDEALGYEFVPVLLVRLIKALRFSDRREDAIARADEGLRLFPGFTDLVFEKASALLGLGRVAEATREFERCIEMGDAPRKYTTIRGCGTYLPRLSLAELHLNRGQTREARELLDWCLEHYPDFYGTVLPYATALLRSGVEPDRVVNELGTRIPDLTPTVRFMLATALYEGGATEAAEQQYRLVLERQPHSSRSRIALAEALLSQRRYEDAAAEAAVIANDDPLAVMASRTELFGRIGGGDLAGAKQALPGAATAGLPEPEVALFAAWADVAAGAEIGRVPVIRLGAIALLNTILEALLRVQDFGAFEALMPLMEHSELPRREQRELLGGMYLRRGFLQSAAEEWMAVCAERPDPRALIGLAHVAGAHGLDEDAATFAAEALALDPLNAVARKLLERYPTAAAA
jgi:glycosyltransferase involved in cell wall biosynthesis